MQLLFMFMFSPSSRCSQKIRSEDLHKFKCLKKMYFNLLFLQRAKNCYMFNTVCIFFKKKKYRILFFINSVLRPFQDYFSSYETGQSVGGTKTEEP